MRGLFHKTRVILITFGIVAALFGCDSGGNPKGPSYVDPLNQPLAERSYSLTQLFERPIIIGASVSAGAYAASPGELVVYQAGAHVISKSVKSGSNSRSHEDYIHQTMATLRPTIVIAVDLFANDYNSADSVLDRTQVADLISLLCKYAGEVYLGLIPERGFPAASAFNSYVPSLQASNPNLHLIALNKMLGKSAQQATLKFPYQQQPLPTSLFIAHNDPEGIHPNIFGSIMIANEIMALIRSSSSGVTDTDLPNLFLNIKY